MGGGAAFLIFMCWRLSDFHRLASPYNLRANVQCPLRIIGVIVIVIAFFFAAAALSIPPQRPLKFHFGSSLT